MYLLREAALPMRNNLGNTQGTFVLSEAYELISLKAVATEENSLCGRFCSCQLLFIGRELTACQTCAQDIRRVRLSPCPQGAHSLGGSLGGR